jgi:hypothetical protein
VGQLHLADISVPEKVYEHLGLKVGPIFFESDIIPIDLPLIRHPTIEGG